MYHRSPQQESTWDQFDLAWSRGEEPSIAAFATAEADAETIVELVKIDIEYRWRQRAALEKEATHATSLPAYDPAEECGFVENYLRQFTCLQNTPRLDLICEEYRARLLWSSFIDPAEYRRRFADLEPVLSQRLLDVEAEVAEETSASASEPLSSVDRWPRIPGYELLEVVGRGATGVVFRARQVSLNRLVAVKMIQVFALRLPHARARFAQEGALAAQIQHPHIAQVFEVGTIDGYPFLVMEYCGGGTLARRLTSQVAPAREAARLVATLARAMAEAHRVSIIHRDLNPANVMIAAPSVAAADKTSWSQLQLKIVDFGLARGTERPPLTVDGQVLGTPAYMAPEQALGHVSSDVRQDVYGLGAILFHLVTGRPPFHADTVLATVERVLHDEPPPLRRLQPLASRDLETICAHCLAKDAARRYATADELADDLDRYLAGQVIHARPTPLLERCWKRCRARPVLATATGVVAVAIVASIVGLLIHFRQLNQQIAIANSERARARQHFHQAFDAVNRLLTRVGVDRLMNADGLDDTQRQVLDDAVKYYAQLMATTPEIPPGMLHEFMRGHRRLGAALANLGDGVAAEKSQREALRLANLTTTAEDVYEVCLETVRSHLDLSETLRASGRNAESYAECAAAERLCRRDVGDDADVAQLLAQAHIGKSICAATLDECDTERRAALAILDDLQRRHPSREGIAALVGVVHHNMGVALANRHDLAAAQREFELARAAIEPLCGDIPQRDGYHRNLAETYGWLAQIYAERQQFALASELYEKTLRTHESLVRRFPTVRLHRAEVARMQMNYGLVLMSAQRLDDAERMLRASTELREELAHDENITPTETRWLAEGYQNLAIVCQNLGRLTEAEAAYQRGADLLIPLCASAREDDLVRVSLLGLYVNRGAMHSASGKIDEALTWLERAEPILQHLQHYLPEHPATRTFTWSAYGTRAQIEMTQGNFREAASHWTQILAVSTPEQQLEYRVTRAICWIHAGEFDLAADDLRRLVDEPIVTSAVCYNAACALSMAASRRVKEGAGDVHPLGEQAIHALRRAKGLGLFRENPTMRDHLRADPDLEYLRSIPEFAAIVSD